MDYIKRVIVILGLAWLPNTAGAMGPPAPISCPEDVDVAIDETCPCDGQVTEGGTEPWRNHGQYVRCVVRYRNALRKAGCLSKAEFLGVARCAARSTCGRTGAVTCCLSETGTCSDGICSNDADVPCDIDDDCTRTRAKIVRDETACVERGGVAGTGSVCNACQP
jgi:hypothetical protein